MTRCPKCGSSLGNASHVCISTIRYDEHQAVIAERDELRAAMQRIRDLPKFPMTDYVLQSNLIAMEALL